MVDKIEKLILFSFLSWTNVLSFILQGQACFDIDFNETINVKTGLAHVVFILFLTEYLLTKELIS